MSIHDLPFKVNVVDLNTMSNPTPHYRDETVRMRCPKCHNLFLLGRGIHEEPIIRSTTLKHIELCEGDAPTALMKVEQAWKAGWRPTA